MSLPKMTNTQSYALSNLSVEMPSESVNWYWSHDKNSSRETCDLSLCLGG